MSNFTKKNIQRIVDKVIANYVQQHSSLSKSQDERDSPNLNELNDVNIDDTSRFQSKKLNFFNFTYQDKSIFDVSTLKNFEKKTIYRDVFIFINRIKHFAITHDVELIRNNLYRCLQNEIFI